MAVLRVLSLLMAVVLAGASVGPSSNNSLCTESRECLQYQLLCKTDEYEVRHYSPTLWVSTDAEAYFMGVGAAMAFRRLFQYITGENEGGYQIDMTAPVLVKIPEETTMWEPAIYTLSFPLPQAYQENPPQPTNDKLYFTEMPDMDVYVRSYGGWMLSVTSRLQAHQLTKELDRVGAKYNCTHHYGVGYDSPLKLLNRHNEVWYVCEGKPVCTDPREPTPPHPPRPRTESPAEGAFPDTPSPQPTRDLSTSSSSQESPIPDPDSDNQQDLPIALALTAATTKPEEESIQETLEESTQETASILSTSSQPQETTNVSISEHSIQTTSIQPQESTNVNTSERSTLSTSTQPQETTNVNTSEHSIQTTSIQPQETISEKSVQSTSIPAAENPRSTSDSSEEITQSASSRIGNGTKEVLDSSDQTAEGSPGLVEQNTQGTLEASEQESQSTHDTPVTTEKSA